MLGGVNFELFGRAILTDEEKNLIQNYKADKEILMKKEVKIPLTGRAIILNITIGSLMQGQSFKCNDISEILEYEEHVKKSCESFKTYIEVMKNFGGKEIVEFN